MCVFTCRMKKLWLSLWERDSVWWGWDRCCTLREEAMKQSGLFRMTCNCIVGSFCMPHNGSTGFLRPHTHSFSSSRWELWTLKPSFSSRSLTFWARSLMLRLSLLYLRHWRENKNWDLQYHKMLESTVYSNTINSITHRCCYSLGVVLPLLNAIFPQHFHLVQVVVHLPVDEVHLLQQFLFMVL